MKKKILVNAYLDRNFGDDLMIEILARALPSYDIYLNGTVDNPLLLLPFKNIANIYAYQLSTNNKKRIKQIRAFDAYIRIGGSLFQVQGDIKSLRGIWKTIDYIKRNIAEKKLKKYNIPYIISGINTGPFKNKLGEKLALANISLASLVTVRDSASYELISKNTALENLYEFPDIVLSSDCPKKLNKQNKKCLGISVYSSSNKKMNFASYNKLAEIADKYIEMTNGKVILYAFDVERQNDLTAAHTILNMTKYKENIEVEGHLGDTSSFIEALNKADIMLAVRFHSAIMAMRIGIPFLPIVYSNKMDNLLDDIGYEGQRIQFKEMEQVNSEQLVRDIIDENNLCLNSDEQIFNRARGHMLAIKAYLEKDNLLLEKLKFNNKINEI